ncbi:tyrosine-type recombinase/integrase [Maritalea mobilis]|uniref:tyrosine-type recombinase/integrase n=1 Tax=Maritalea mobilis TaxID=483324 RepID=UPI001C9725CF|nr:site-specific integrase [Maritalea mobilis]MBY6201015.1 tyrosine-type recombinase/integrase [Maritalea mobilis]
MALTVKQIEAARFGIEKERLSDGGGLYLRLFPNGSKRFQVQVARAPGSKSRGWITLGAYPELSLKAARGMAAQVRAMADEGKTIDDIRGVMKGECVGGPETMGSAANLSRSGHHPNDADLPPDGSDLLLREAAKEWFENKRKSLSSGKHIDQNWNTIAAYVLPTLGDMPVSTIHMYDIIETLAPIWHAKNTTASRTLARLREIIERARIKYRLEIANPAVFCTRTAFGYTRHRTKHHAALPLGRVQEFWQWLEEVRCDETTRLATQLLVLTGKRTNEVRFAEWALIDAAQRIWNTDARLMKSRLPHRVPLSHQATRVLENASFLTGGKKLVFAKPSTKSGSFSENTILNLVKRFDPELTGHGFRANFKTWSRRAKGYDFDAIEFSLAHVQTKLEEAYMRDDLIEERAELMQDWADFVTDGSLPQSLRQQLGRG